MVKITSVLAGAAAVAAVSAQQDLPNISAGCTGTLFQLALGDLGQCLQMTTLLQFIGQSGSIIDPLNNYLGQLCADGAPTCSNQTLDDAQSQLNQSCSGDLENAGANGGQVNALFQIFDHYDEVRTAACSRNDTTNEYCLTSTLEQVQNVTGQDVSADFFLNVLTGSGDSISQLSDAFSSGEFCTGCVATIYQQAVMANGSIEDTELADTLEQQCGNQTLTNPSGVQSSSPASSSASPSASGASGSSSGNAAGAVQVVSSGAVIGSVVMLGAVALGGALVL